jgi:hypothetical protein
LPSATSFLQGIVCEHPLLLLRSSVPPNSGGELVRFFSLCDVLIFFKIYLCSIIFITIFVT